MGTAARSTVLSSTGGKSIRDNIVNVFGSRLADGLVQLSAGTAGGSQLEGYRHTQQLTRNLFDMAKLTEDFRGCWVAYETPAPFACLQLMLGLWWC